MFTILRYVESYAKGTGSFFSPMHSAPLHSNIPLLFWVRMRTKDARRKR